MIAGPQHVVEPGLQGRGHAEIVHGRPDDEGIGGLEFGDQLVRQGSGGGLGRVAGLASAQRRGGVDGQVRNGIAAEIPGDDPQGGIMGAQAGDGFRDELAGHGGFAEGAAGDHESCGHETILPRVLVLAVRPR